MNSDNFRQAISNAFLADEDALVESLIAKAKLKSDEDRSALTNRVMPVIREFKEQLFLNGELRVAFRGRRLVCTPRELERRPSFKTALAEISCLYEECLAELMQAGRRGGVSSIGVVLAGGGSRIPAIRNAIVRPRWMGLGVRIKHLPETPAWVRDIDSENDYEPLFSQMSAAFGAAISAPEQTETTDSQKATMSV